MKLHLRIAFFLAVVAVLLVSPAAWGAIQDGDLIRISRPNTNYLGAGNTSGYADTDRAYGGALYGGEFRIVGPVDSSGNALAGAEVFKTFCLEYKEHISIPQNYYATRDDGAMAGGPGSSGTPLKDVLGTATKWFYNQYRTSSLAGKGGFAYDDHNWADALQLVFWRLEEEVLWNS